MLNPEIKTPADFRRLHNQTSAPKRRYNFGFPGDNSEPDASIINNIEPRILESIEAYIQQGRPLGDFLQAVIANNLMEALGRADLNNRRHCFEICQIFYNYAPSSCHGDKERYRNWVTRGGIEGISAEISAKTAKV